MKNIRKIMTAVAVLLSAAACNIETWKENAQPADGSIVFGAYTWSHNSSTGTLTRTEYSGELIGSTTKYERINWLPGYDMIRIASPEATTGNGEHGHTYAVESLPETNQAGSRYSRAGLGATDNNRGLHWADDNTHHFFAMYPGPGTISPEGKAPTVGEFMLTSLSGGGAKINAVIPELQRYESVTNGVFAPDMTRAPMWAYNTGRKSDTEGVFLSFEPLFTAYELTLLAGDSQAEDLILKEVRLESATDYLSGAFEAQLSASGALTLPNSYTDPEKYVEVTIAETDRQKLSPTSVVKVTLLTLPCDQTKLTLDLLFERGGLETHRKIDLKKDENNDGVYSDSEWLTMIGCKKIYIRGINVPGELLFYDMDPVPPITVPANDAVAGLTNSFLVNTEADAEDGYQGLDRTKATPWIAYYLPSDVAQPAKGTVWSDVEGISATPTEDWFKPVDSGSGPGHDDLFRYKAHAVREETIDWNASPEAYEMKTAMATNGHAGAIDLSTIDIITGQADNDTETANCYIIDGYGTYLIPLVYGNAYVNGENPGSYTLATVASATEHANTRGFGIEESPETDVFTLHRFYNAFGRTITTPYILPDTQAVMTDLGSSRTYTVDDLEARVVWQDVRSGSEILLDSDLEVVQSPAGAAIPGCAYLRINVRQASVKPGNVLVSVVGKNDERMQDTFSWNGTEVTAPKTLWSWHLWFRHDRSGQELTNERVLTVDNMGSPLVLSEELGWTPPISYVAYTSPQETQRIVFVSAVTGRVLSGTTVTRETSITPTFTGSRYSNTFYNWGRKDPFLPGNGDNTNKPVTSDHYDILPSTANSTTEVNTFVSSGSAISIREMDKIEEGYTPPTETDAATDYKYFSSFPWLANQAFVRVVNAWNNVRQSYKYDEVQTRLIGGNKEKFYPFQMESIKTVYDPSPRRYAVPEARTFSGFGNLETESSVLTGTKIYGIWKTQGQMSGRPRYPAGHLCTDSGVSNTDTYVIYMPASGQRAINAAGTSGAGITRESLFGASWLDVSGSYKLPKTRFLVETTYSWLFWHTETQMSLMSYTESTYINALLPVRPVRQHLNSKTVGVVGEQKITDGSGLDGWSEQ